MAAGTRQTNTLEEKLRKLLPMISELKLADDVDLEFATDLETRLIGKIREPIDRMNAMSQAASQPAAPPADPMGGGMGGMGMDPMAAAMGGPMMGGPPPDQMMGQPTPGPGMSEAQGMPVEMLAALLASAPPAPAQAQRGLQPSPAMPQGDELRRVLGQ